MAFRVIIVGRPNVGKSTLFNRLVGKAMALTADQPGVTRDVRVVPTLLAEKRVEIADTAGLDDGPRESLPQRQRVLTEAALTASDLVIFVVDGREGVTADDKAWARRLRKLQKPLLLAVNKCDGSKVPAGYYEAERLGFPDIFAIAAEHRDGISELTSAILAHVPDDAEAEDVEAPVTLAIVGRPNAGKSTLVNQLLGDERVLTGPEAGLTRDSIILPFTAQGHKLRLVDTAGLRRKAKVVEDLEQQAAEASFRVIRLAQIVILLVDATQGLDKQDLALASHVAEEGRNLIIVLNKWDAVQDGSRIFNAIRHKIDHSLFQLAGLPILTASARTGKDVDRIVPVALEQYRRWQSRIGTGELNRWLAAMIEANAPPLVGGRRIKLRYMTQSKTRPPTFLIFANKPSDVPTHYLRYLMNGLREAYDLEGVPLRIQLRGGKNPYADKE